MKKFEIMKGAIKFFIAVGKKLFGNFYGEFHLAKKQ
jgi:hypothetical protein